MTGEYKAVLFDLDGVLAPTATLHQLAWKTLFSSYLAECGANPPYSDDDYYNHIDGRPRFQGVAALLESRGIALPWGDPTDPADANTVCGLGNRKNVVFLDLLAKGIEPYPEVAELLDVLAQRTIKVAVVTSSRNGAQVLAQTGLAGAFRTVVDGIVVAERGLRGKPAPDAFLLAAALLGVDPDQAVVVEDALSGVAAGKSGGFGLTVGVDRGEVGADALREAGADIVVTNLLDMLEAIVDDPEVSDPVDRSRFPADPWKIIEIESPTHQADQLSATLFNQANGYLGIRGSGEAFRGFGFGTLINGFHETYPIKHAEDAYGLARVGQFLQGVPDGMGYRIRVDGADLETARLESGRTELDFRTGVSVGTRIWRFADGTRIRVVERRLVSLFDRHLAAIEVTATPLEAGALVELDFEMESREAQVFETDGFADPRGTESSKGGGLELRYSPSTIAGRCRNSRLAFACGWRDTPAGEQRVERGAGVTSVRYLAYHSQPVIPVGTRAGLAVTEDRDLHFYEDAASRDATRAREIGFADMVRRQQDWLCDFWTRSDVAVDGPGVGAQQAIRWSIFQLAQVSAQVEAGIAAKGVSGAGYSGHYFWDTEVYALPFLVYTNPDAARRVLDYRYAMLPAARERARIMSLRGALFPWRTINGEEASAYYPAGTAQYHIDADVAYAVAQYVMATGDRAFLTEEGIDILVETARMWADLGFTGEDGLFHIHQVTGPDEYSAVVDDNLFTNAMARFNLRQAAALWESLPEAVREAKTELLGVSADEPARWREAAETMAIPWDARHGVHPQDSMFLQREPWTFDDDPTPLLLRYHPLVIYRHQVLKQADVVLALQMLPDEFTPEQKLADYEYYDRLTTGDSTLSAPTQCIVAAEVGLPEAALHYFHESLYTDLADGHDNASMGVHVASAAGIWQCLVRGFGGLYDATGGAGGEGAGSGAGAVARLEPRLPEDWKSLDFGIMVSGAGLRVTVTPESIALRWLSGPEATLEVCGQTVTLGSSHREQAVGL